MIDEEYYKYYRHASGAWYLVPIFLGIIGGVIMWLALRKEDPRKAKKGLIVAVIVRFHRSSYLLGNRSIPSFVGRNDSASNCNAAANNPPGLIFSFLSFIILAACMITSEIMNGL
jgi:hypothetical protein